MFNFANAAQKDIESLKALDVEYDLSTESWQSTFLGRGALGIIRTPRVDGQWTPVRCGLALAMAASVGGNNGRHI